jgi:4-hydroxy-3-methylbut-2-enyl diphosphate reductase
MTETYFQKGLGLKAEVLPMLALSYKSPVVETLKALGYSAAAGDIHVTLAREFGFCYGVDRAVEYAYETRARFPDRRIHLSGEIIHNPDVNHRLHEMGIEILPAAADPAIRYAQVHADDVVILPAFGVTVPEMAHLTLKGCVLVDTTCGSVLNVWKKVHRCARDGFTVVIHGKHHHEETRATASQTLGYPGAHYLCVRDLRQTDVLCAYLRGEIAASALLETLEDATSIGFDPERDLQRIGIANQTTMLMTETLAVQERLHAAMRDRYGEAALEERFRAFDTICSATQDRQDAVTEMLAAGSLDAVVVIGGYNSSNTQALARMCAARLPTYHIDRAECIDGARIRHRSVVGGDETVTEGWLAAGAVRLGVTAGASTPDSIVGDVLSRILASRGHTTSDLRA